MQERSATCQDCIRVNPALPYLKTMTVLMIWHAGRVDSESVLVKYVYMEIYSLTMATKAQVPSLIKSEIMAT